MNTHRLGRGERVTLAAVGTAAGALGVVGAVNSFATVASVVRPSFGGLAWTVPVAVDLGIAVFTGLDVVLARLDMRPRWLRLVPWALIATTLLLNTAAEPTVGAVAHGVLAGLWVVSVEAATHVVRVFARLTSGGQRRMDRVRASRWLLAPVSTARLWRRMVLWEVTEYPAALRRERARLLARCDLADRHGPLSWRWKAPRRARTLYRLGELTPAGAITEPTMAAPSSGGKATRRRSASKAASGPRASTVDVDAMAAVVAAELAAAGKPVSRRALLEGLRARGCAVSTTRAGQLAAQLRNRPTAGLEEPSSPAPLEEPVSSDLPEVAVLAARVPLTVEVRVATVARLALLAVLADEAAAYAAEQSPALARRLAAAAEVPASSAGLLIPGR